MLKKPVTYVAALVLCLTATASIAQEAGLDQTDGITVSIGNTGPERVDIGALIPSESAETDGELISLAPDEYLEADLPVGTKINVFQPGQAAEEGEERKPFMTYTVLKAPQEQNVAIPDPRALFPVEVTFINDTSAEANLSLHDVGAPRGLKDLGNLEPGAQTKLSVRPGAVLVGRALDGSVLATFQISRDSTHSFSLHESTIYKGQTVPITVENMSGVPIAVKQVFPQSIVRIAAIPPWHRTTVDAAVGSDLKVETNSAHVRVLMQHRVTDELDQDILVSHDLAMLNNGSDVDSVALERLPADIRESTKSFLENAENIKRSNPDAAVIVMANMGKSTTAYGVMEGQTVSNYRTIEPGKTMRGLMRVGARLVLWPGEIAIGDLALTDIQKVVDLSRKTPAIADFSMAPSTRTTVHNDACRPLDLFKVDAFGSPVQVGRLEPAGGTVTVEGHQGAELFARLTDASQRGGTTYWRALMGAGDNDVLRVRTADEFAHDDIAFPRIPKDAAKNPRTLLVTNFTSRPISVFQIDPSGAVKQMFNADGSPVILGSGTDKTFYTPEGAAMVFRRPNAPVNRSEYGRYRVTAEPNQAVEIGELKTRARKVAGAWSFQPQNEAPSENDYGTLFMNVVATGDGDAIEGSSNILQTGDSINATEFEGCAHGGEGYGVWFPKGAVLKCDTPHIARDGTSHTSYGRFRMSLVGDKMRFTYGYCDETPNRVSEWFPQPDHFDDMDPDNEGLTHGMMETAWAPPSFEWLGRGFNLLYADPLNYASTEEPRAHSQKPLFNFIYEDAQGRTLDSNAKSIFGVTHNNARAASSDCRQTQKQVRTMADMHDFSSKSVGGSIGVPGIASFSLSKSHSEKNNSATGSEHVFIMERCDLRMDELNVNARWSDQSGYDLMRQPLEPGFRRAVENLPTEWVNHGKALKVFLETYGTHFSERVVYGGTFFAETKVKKETFQRGFEISDGLGVEATGTVKKVQLGGSYKSEDSEGRNDGNKHANSEYHKWSIGGNGTGIYDSWVTSVTGKDQLRAPIEVQFREITDLLTPVFFPNDPEIGLKNDLVRRGIQIYYKQFAGKDLTTQDLAQGLHVRDPRQICVEMSALEVKSRDAGGYFSGALRGTIVDRSGEVVSEASNTIGLGLKTTDRNIRPDGYLAYAVPASKEVMFTFKEDSQFGWVNTFCTSATKADYVWDGSLCLEGIFTMNDSSTDSWSGNCTFSPKLYNLDDLERNIPKVIKDSFATPSAEVEYEIRVWVP